MFQATFSSNFQSFLFFGLFIASLLSAERSNSFSYYGVYPNNHYNNTYQSTRPQYYDNGTDAGVYYRLGEHEDEE